MDEVPLVVHVDPDRSVIIMAGHYGRQLRELEARVASNVEDVGLLQDYHKINKAWVIYRAQFTYADDELKKAIMRKFAQERYGQIKSLVVRGIK